MNNKVKSAIAVTLTGIVLLSTSAIKLNKNKKYDGLDITTSISMEEEITNNIDSMQTTKVRSIDATTVARNGETNSSIGTTRVVSKMEISDIYSKNYNKEATELLESTIRNLEENYDQMRLIYPNCDLPEKEEFISNFIETIVNNIDTIEIVEPNYDSDYSAMLGGALEKAFVSEGLLLINKELLPNDKETNLIHGVFHFTQEKLIDDQSNISPGIYKILTEGEASWYSAFTNSSNFTSAFTVTSTDGKLCYMRGLGGGDYPKYSRAYNMLMNLVGYSNIEACKENYNENIIINAIKEKYNINAKEFVDSLDLICMYDGVSVDEIIAVENTYLSCLSQDLSSIDNKDDLLKFYNQYRAYRRQFFISCSKDEETITDEVINFKTVDDMLLQKLTDYQIFPEGYEQAIFDLTIKGNSYQILSMEEASIYNINYYVEGDNVILINKTNKNVEKYNISTEQVVYSEFDESMIEQSAPLVSEDMKKTL